MCPVCELETDDWGKKGQCRNCNRDWESSERDAKVAGEHEFWLTLSKDLPRMREFLNEWRSKVGPSRGPGYKRGGFQFAVYKKVVGTKAFTKNTEEKVLVHSVGTCFSDLFFYICHPLSRKQIFPSLPRSCHVWQ